MAEILRIIGAILMAVGVGLFVYAIMRGIR